MDSLRGQLLVASPTLLDPNFRRTVILIAEHNDEGAMGVVLNRPSETAVTDAAPELGPLVEDGEPVFVGGPVQATAIVVLAEFDDPENAGLLALEDVGLVGGDTDLGSIGDVTRRVRVFAGYSGWGTGQLESELGRDDWILARADREDVFGEDPGGLWSVVLTRLGGQYALVARMPLDPGLN